MSETIDRFARQADLVPRKIQETPVTVVGVGAVGREVARQLVCMGTRRLRLVDHDTVEHSNRTTQGYGVEDVGLTKVKALSRTLALVDPEVEVEAVPERWSLNMKLPKGSAVFTCVDKLGARGAIWGGWGSQSACWFDPRVLAYTIYLFSADEYSRGYYPRTLTPQARQEEGRCTASLTIGSASVAAALATKEYLRWLYEDPVRSAQMFDMETGIYDTDVTGYFTEGLAAA